MPDRQPDVIRRPRRRDVILGGALLATAGAAHALRPREAIDLLGANQLDRIVPNQVGSWRFLSNSGLVVPPEDDLADALYAQLLTKSFVAENLPPMMLLIAQSASQDGVLQVHRPEYCYPAGGFSLSRSQLRMLPMPTGQVVPATTFSAVSSGRTEQLLYWTRVGHSLPTSWAEQRWVVAKANLRGYVPDGVLVRVSTISPDPAALDLVADFARALVAAMPPASRAVLVGSA